MGLLKKISKGDTTRSVQAGSNAGGEDPEAQLIGMRIADALDTGHMLQGRYQIEKPIGVGGMSVVYRGRDMRFKDVVRVCAIKEMYQSAPDSQTRMLSLRLFEREAGLLATLNHPAIPKIYDFFEEGNRVYLVLEFVNGQDLEEVLETTTEPLTEVEVAQWASQVCDVLTYLHEHKPEPIVFRDLKPSNVMVTSQNRVILIDFGIARHFDVSNRKGTLIGTEGYSPPEQYRGLSEPRGDVYALGATMHHLLTRSDPRLETPFTFQERPVRQFNPAVSAEMEAIVDRALSYDLNERWPSAAALKEALLRISGVIPIPDLTGASQSSSRNATPAAPAKPVGAEVLWSFACEDEVRSSPYVANGQLFIGCYDHNLYALESDSGRFLWKYATEGGIASSPLVWQDSVIVGSEDGSIYAFETRRSTIRWTYRTEKPVRSSPRANERIVVVGSDDFNVYALEASRGGLLWKFRTWSPFRSSAGIAGELMYIGCDDGNLYCLAIKDGSMMWKQRTQQAIFSTPAVGNGLVVVGSMDQNLYAFDAQSGWVVWKVKTAHAVNSSPVIHGGRAYVGSADGGLYCVELKNGKVAWKFETDSQISASPRIEGNKVYIGATNGTFYCLDADRGSVNWTFQSQAALVSSPFILDGVVYIGSLDHHVYALKA